MIYVIRRLVWRVLPPSKIKLFTGNDFFLPRESLFASDLYVTGGIVDWGTERILCKYTRDHPAGGDFIDVGANIGFYSVLVDKVFAFEPDIRNHKNLKSNVSRYKNVEIVKMAVANECGKFHLTCDGDSTVSHLDLNNHSSSLAVDVITLDKFIKNKALEPIAIKVDVEGFDVLVLEGAITTAKEYKPLFVIEYNIEPNRPNSLERLESFLTLTDYSLFAISRVDKSISSPDYTFGELEIADLPNLHVKMLLIVHHDHKALLSSCYRAC